LAKTSVLAVPRSMARSLEKRLKSDLNAIRCCFRASDCC
jgi:hypothetical protein